MRNYRTGKERCLAILSILLADCWAGRHEITCPSLAHSLKLVSKPFVVLVALRCSSEVVCLPGHTRASLLWTLSNPVAALSDISALLSII